MSESMQERTEEATPKRRQDARKKGTVAKSVELTNALVLLSMLGALPFISEKLGQEMMKGMNMGLRQFPTSAEPGEMGRHFMNLLQPIMLAFMPLLLIAMVVGVAANFAQVGFVLSTESINPSLSKINPFKGLKRMFSMHAGMEGFKSVVKCTIFTYLSYQVLAANWGSLVNLSMASPHGALAVIGDILKTIFLRIAFAWLVLAALDYFFQRKQVEKQLKMTKEEVKQEFKQNEQSPEIKAAMAQKRRRLVKGRMAQAVKTADVIITNPTHFAVALKYDRATMFAPQVVAKGADHLAFRIRELAKESGVAIVPNPPLARQLYKKCEVGDFVPRELFQAVAEVLAYVMSTLKKVRSAA
jgi:flagellar biosynthetic protein FlhB